MCESNESFFGMTVWQAAVRSLTHRANDTKVGEEDPFEMMMPANVSMSYGYDIGAA